MPNRILVAIPPLDEPGTVAAVIAELRANAPMADMLVIDDGSTDDTVAGARAVGPTAQQQAVHVGVGGALRTAIFCAQADNHDRVRGVAGGRHAVLGVLGAAGVRAVQSRVREVGCPYPPPGRGMRPAAPRPRRSASAWHRAGAGRLGGTFGMPRAAALPSAARPHSLLALLAIDGRGA